MNVLVLLLCAQTLAPARAVAPVLAFPEPGVDDTAAYQGYSTRFYRDSRSNTVQVYLATRDGRVVQLWADSDNASVGFTARDAAGRPVPLRWGGDSAVVADSGRVRTIGYRLVADAPRLELGWFVLGSMRVERDFQYAEHHRRPFGAAEFRVEELDAMLARLDALPRAERRRHLALLGARRTRDVRDRLRPTLRRRRDADAHAVVIEQRSLDGRSVLRLEIGVDPREAELDVGGRTVAIRSRTGRPVTLAVRASTDAATLTPLAREQIFGAEFLGFLAAARAAHDSVLRAGAPVPRSRGDSVVRRYRRLERQVRGVELLSSADKLMAGLPSFATYFGRDMMMTALLMQPIWSPAMAEHVIASVLRKLSPTGEVSHEEALGGQAIREGAAEYAALLAEQARAARDGDRGRADSLLAGARAVLGDLQRVRENYIMRDDDFQLAVLAGRYLADPAVPAERKRAFLLGVERGGVTRLGLLLRNLRFVAASAAPYGREAATFNLIGFPQRDERRWFPGSWRDSGAGYANGRYAMDINVVWVPQALEATGAILASLATLGIGADSLARVEPSVAGSPLAVWAAAPDSLHGTLRSWRGTARHFRVAFGPDEVRRRVEARLAALPSEERAYWTRALAARAPQPDSLVFLALSLDTDGRPIPVVSTDPALRFFLEELTGAVLRDSLDAGAVLQELDAMIRPYPVGLLVAGLGPVVANDAYASADVWGPFEADRYHSPRVVWGREVNLLVLGLGRQLSAALDGAGRPRSPSLERYARALADALHRTRDAVEASGLQHNELWSYHIDGGRLVPVRYGTSSDVQLWNTTELAVEFMLSRLPRR